MKRKNHPLATDLLLTFSLPLFGFPLEGTLAFKPPKLLSDLPFFQILPSFLSSFRCNFFFSLLLNFRFSFFFLSSTVSAFSSIHPFSLAKRLSLLLSNQVRLGLLMISFSCSTKFSPFFTSRSAV